MLFGAGTAAGAINSLAGGGTLVSFPALLWLGRAPIVANATNTVALCPGALAAMFAFRHDLASIRRWLLFTADAHGLYARFGFAPLADPTRCLTIVDEALYDAPAP